MSQDSNILCFQGRCLVVEYESRVAFSVSVNITNKTAGLI